MEVVNNITILGGLDKNGKYEDIELTLNCGEVIAIVGKTGAGKSCLLEDIECIAQKDTPTKRKILINGKSPEDDYRFNIENKLVAELSQNMNFVMDLGVKEFIMLHADTRGVKDLEKIADEIIENANNLAGEKFEYDTPLTELSGGQSRSLMIADTARLSNSPIILIDEIENAGVDKKKALDLLIRSNKIIIMSTHDPLLALLCDKRIIIKNGGIDKIITTAEEEKTTLEELYIYDSRIQKLRESLREGREMDLSEINYFQWEE